MKTQTKNSISVVGNEWTLFVTRNMSFWHQVVSMYGHYYYPKVWGMKVPLEQLALTVGGTETHVFKNKENAQSFADDVLETFSTRERITKIKKLYQTFAEQLLKKLTSCLKDFSLKNWAKFSESYARFCHGLAVTATMGRVGTDRLVKRLLVLGYKESEVPSVVSVITYPPHHTPLFSSSLDLLKVGAKVQNRILKSDEIDEALTIWLDNYRYIPVNFVDEPWTLKDARESLKNFLQKDCEEEIISLDKNHKERLLTSQKLLKKINNKEVALLAYALQQATFLNEFRKNVFSKASLEIRPLFKKIAEKAKLKSWKECYYLMPDEIVGILKGVTVPVSDIVAKRDVVGIYTTPSGDLVFLSERETKKVYDFIKSLHSAAESRPTKDEKTVKGFSASAGTLKGIIKIVLTSKDFPKLKVGEILVTTMTSVDFVPVMEKAAAFITNEGGITSHAAIVAREMKKPCIIGTKVATQVLKDGDLVEVDADKGIVKILKRS